MIPGAPAWLPPAAGGPAPLANGGIVLVAPKDVQTIVRPGHGLRRATELPSMTVTLAIPIYPALPMDIGFLSQRAIHTLEEHVDDSLGP